MPCEALDRLIRPDRGHGPVHVAPASFDLEMRQIFGHAGIFPGHESQAAHTGDHHAARVDLLGPAGALGDILTIL